MKIPNIYPTAYRYADFTGKIPGCIVVVSRLLFRYILQVAVIGAGTSLIKARTAKTAPPSGHHFLFSALVLLLLVPFSLFGQEKVDTKAFFARAAEGGTLIPAAGGQVRMPWFENYEFRTETRDFDPGRQEYTFRLSPSTRGKVRAQESLYRHLEVAPDFEAADESCQLLAERYAGWLEMYLLTREADLLDRLERVRRDQATVLNRLAGTLDFDWSELIKVRQDRTDLQVDHLIVQDRNDYLHESYGLQKGAADFTDLITLSEVLTRIQASSPVPADPELAYEIETISRELALERAEQKQYLDFAQIKYQGPHKDPARERISVGVAFQLPNSGNQVIKVRELELEAEALRREQDRESFAEGTDFDSRKQLLLNRFRRYYTFAELYLQEATEFDELSRKLATREGIDLLPLLKIKARALRNELKLLRAEAALYNGYLDMMERNGEVCTGKLGEVLR